MSSASLMRVHSDASSKLLIQMSNRTGPSNNPLLTGFCVEYNPLTTSPKEGKPGLRAAVTRLGQMKRIGPMVLVKTGG